MIEKLTPHQEKQLEVYKNKWLDIGLATGRLSLDRAIEIKNGLYEHVLKYDKNVPVFLMDSPLSAFNATMILSECKDLKNINMEDLLKQVKERNVTHAKDFFFPYIYGQFDAGYIAFYDYMFTELGIENPVKDAFEAFKATSETGCIYAMKEFCVIAQKPIKVSMVNGKLHCNGAPAWEYADGVKGWSLNGVAVPQYLAETPEGELDINWYLEQKNADVKAEFVRKYGIERMLAFGKKVDDYTKYNDDWWTKSEYEVWNMGKLFDADYQPFLKMKNQTTGIWHMEAVHPDCKDLPDAIKFRFEGKQFKIINIK